MGECFLLPSWNPEKCFLNVTSLERFGSVTTLVYNLERKAEWWKLQSTEVYSIGHAKLQPFLSLQLRYSQHIKLTHAILFPFVLSYGDTKSFFHCS